MKERPVIFNGEMVRAILDGRKTQTRRIMKVQPEPSKTRAGDFWFSSKKLESMVHVSDFMPGNSPIADCHLFFQEHCCPFGPVGERLWVRETFMDLTGTGIEATTGKFEGFAYRADTPAGSYGDEVRKEYGLKWTPSLHMPRKACRILLEITAVRVERLNDISHDDAKAEGCCYGRGGGVPDFAVTPADHFPTLWASIYGEESWRANPWVWVISFRRVK
ncbi:hypothetical protein [Serratia ureilytica]|uniref:hypothetical protein n=1 Tax=Serratia ureilytica TaxID=300181 RepID=UPI0018D8D449|nr:hypothetical protein [Serratia ureilytica]MBH3006798.1 hypothetical protein [Serratia ureilytica]